MQAEALAQLDQLRASRVRIVETGDAERRRLERDLHDGAQQRLLALSYDLRLARAQAQADGDAPTGSLLTEATDQAQAALGELRELCPRDLPGDPGRGRPRAGPGDPGRRGSPPGRDPRRGRGRYPAAVETAAYLLVAEALDDAAGRGASHATVSVVQDGGRLVVTVEDDGTEPHLRDGPAGRPGRRPGRQAGGRTDAAPGGAPVRVVVADDVLLTREGIVRLLRDAGIEVVAEAEDAQGLLRQVRLHRPDVALVDIRMPPTHTDEGLVAAQTIRAEHPQVGVLVLSQYVEPSYAMRLIQEHPERVGYLLKERVFDIATVVDALRRIVDGETVIDPTIVSRLVGRRRRAGPARRPQRAGTRGPRADRRGHVQPGHRRPAVRHRTHRRGPRHPDLPEAPPPRVARPAPPRAGRPRLPPRLTGVESVGERGSGLAAITRHVPDTRRHSGWRQHL